MPSKATKPTWGPRGWIGRAADAILRDLAPERALRRQRARQMLAVSDGWDVASLGRKRRTGSLAGGSADAHQTAANLKQLRELCRAHDRQSAVFSGILNRAVENVLGSSFRWHATTADEPTNARIDQYIGERAMAIRSDARGMNDLAEAMGLALRAVWTDGDALAVHREDGGLQWYEADQFVTPLSPPDGRRIVNGVELDPRGRPVAFWLGDRKWGGWTRSTEDAVRVSAADAVFVPNLRRSSQTRGVPALAAALSLYERFDGYVENEALAAEIDSMLAFFIVREPGYSASTLLPGQGQQTRADGTAQTLQKIEPGAILELFPGEKVEPFHSTRPGEIFGTYTEAVLSMIGASIGMPLILVLLDFRRVNYSSARAALLEARRSFRHWQRFIRRRAFDPIYQRWIAQGIADGDLPACDDIFSVDVGFSGWEWVDPLKEVEADIGAIRGGLETYSDVVEKRGLDFETLCQRRQKDEATLERYGITVHLQDVTFPPEAEPAGGADREADE